MASSGLTANMAIIRPDRRLHLLGANGKSLFQTGPADPTLLYASWTGPEQDLGLYSWPTWSPDGTQVACFRVPRQGQTPELIVHTSDGVLSQILAQFDDRIPIYCQWSPDGKSLALLCQVEERLALSRISLATGVEHPLLKGSPLFFTWADCDHIACFVGETNNRVRMALLNIRTRAMELLPGQPGNFCTPVVLGDKVAYVAHREGGLSVWMANQHEARRLMSIHGLAALMPSPNQKLLAVATAENERSSYRKLRILDLETLAFTSMNVPACEAFFWTPDGEALLVAEMDRRSGVVAWSRVTLDGEVNHLGDIKPSRDLRFYLRFFEQFATSHPIISPDGKSLLLPGELDRTGNESGLWRIPLDGAPPVRVGEGLLGIWGPAP
ncbi:MAG: hypothetical protein GWP91_05970 [Rhodobacterales bacterium]|nr:hypothetical protein [Rhodobacterales bacterium]